VRVRVPPPALQTRDQPGFFFIKNIFIGLMKYQKAIRLIQNKLDEHKPRKFNSKNLIPSAVLIPFFNKDHNAHILFTVRTNDVEHHKGQISFPGGSRENQDQSLAETALRECYEEIGISSQIINIIGRLDDFPTVTNFLVTPFVATLPYPYHSKINTKEVAEILEVPLELFLSAKHFEVKEWKHKNKQYPIYFYYFNQHIIWGATAFIINRFIDLIFGYNPAPKSILEDPRNDQYLDENIN
jgi:8-oxo-dGTP pyrophosphatase MutT (NUDIX family)